MGTYNDKLVQEMADRLAILEARVNYLDGVRDPTIRRARPKPLTWAAPQGAFGVDHQSPAPEDLMPRAAPPGGDWFDPASGLSRNAAGEVVRDQAEALVEELTR